MGDGGLARAREASEEDGEATLGLGRVDLAQDGNDTGVGEPRRDLVTVSHHLAELGAANGGSLGALWHLVVGQVLVGRLDVHELLEEGDLDANLVLVLCHQLLGVVGAVKVLTRGALAACVVTADNKVGGAVVLADNGMPQRLAGSRHAHRERQQAQKHATLLVVWRRREHLQLGGGQPARLARLARPNCSFFFTFP